MYLISEFLVPSNSFEMFSQRKGNALEICPAKCKRVFHLKICGNKEQENIFDFRKHNCQIPLTILG